MRWVLKAVLGWLEEVVGLFLRYSVGEEDNESAGTRSTYLSDRSRTTVLSSSFVTLNGPSATGASLCR